jgi:MacB-like periplasmic core domain/FtsX-like permease family
MKWRQTRKRDADLERELRSDLELEEEERLESGISPEEARYAARRAFGNVTLIRERTRETWGWAPFEQLFRDFRHALRQLHKSPGFGLTAVLTLAIGLGSASAIFCLMDTLWFHPMHVPHAGQISRVFSTTPQNQEGDFSYIEYQTFAQRMPAFSGLAAIGGRGSLMAQPDGTSRMLLTNVVSSNFFDVLGVRARLGRLFTAADAASLRAHPAIVLGYRCWQREFNADPSIVGRSIPLRHGKEQDPIGQLIRIDRTGSSTGFAEARILGITEDAPINRIGELPEPFLYVPFHQYATKLSNMGEMTLVLATAPSAMSMAQTVRQAIIHVNALLDPMFITSQPELLRYSAGNYQMMAELVTALGVIGLALTVVGLYGFLAFRVTQRRREIGIRMALGATRRATTLLILRDTARMVAMGLAIGLALALVAARIETAALFGVSPLDAISIAAAFCTLALAMIAASWLPARRAASVEPIEALRYE